MNDSNLIPNSQRSPKELRENGRKGGIASGKARAERKSLREELLLLLSNGDTQNKISLALIEQAQKGNTKAYEIIADMVGEKPQANVKITGEVNNPFAGMSTEELRKIVNGK